jgi:hypothetical protein
MSNTGIRRQQRPYFQPLKFMAERGGLYCSNFRNSLAFYYFLRNTCIFCRLCPSLSSLISLSNALQSLQWTSKVPKKSNTSNKPGAAFVPTRTKVFQGRGGVLRLVVLILTEAMSEVAVRCRELLSSSHHRIIGRRLPRSGPHRCGSRWIRGGEAHIQKT